MTITPETQAKLDKAFADRDTAHGADDVLAHAQETLVLAQHDVDTDSKGSRDAHQQATASAHDALAALATELNFPLPG